MFNKNLTKLLVLFFLITFFMYAKLAKAQIVTDGLVAYWPLDKDTISGDTVEDVWGENDGTIEGNPKIVTGKVGSALEFGGEDSVDIEGTESLNFNGKKELTVAAWVNIKGHSGECCDAIVAQRDANGWALRYDNRAKNKDAEMTFIVHNTAGRWVGGPEGFGVPLFKEGEWHHLTGVLDVDKLLLYADGEFLKEMAFSGAIASAGPETEIGHALDGGFIGLIDEVLIYEKALSEEEVKRNYQAKGMAVVSLTGKLATSWGGLKRAGE